MKITYIEAIRQALWEEMERDESVFLMGEDIGHYGGAFKITQGFLEEVRRRPGDRYPHTRIGDQGAATGAALMGFDLVAEMQFAYFIAVPFDEVVQHAREIPIPQRDQRAGGHPRAVRRPVTADRSIRKVRKRGSRITPGSKWSPRPRRPMRKDS